MSLGHTGSESRRFTAAPVHSPRALTRSSHQRGPLPRGHHWSPGLTQVTDVSPQVTAGRHWVTDRSQAPQVRRPGQSDCGGTCQGGSINVGRCRPAATHQRSRPTSCPPPARRHGNRPNKPQTARRVSGRLIANQGTQSNRTETHNPDRRCHSFVISMIIYDCVGSCWLAS